MLYTCTTPKSGSCTLVTSTGHPHTGSHPKAYPYKSQPASCSLAHIGSPPNTSRQPLALSGNCCTTKQIRRTSLVKMAPTTNGHLTCLCTTHLFKWLASTTTSTSTRYSTSTIAITTPTNLPKRLLIDSMHQLSDLINSFIISMRLPNAQMYGKLLTGYDNRG